MAESEINFDAFLASLEQEVLPRVQQAAETAIIAGAHHILGEAQAITPTSPTNPNMPGAGATPPSGIPPGFWHGKDSIKTPGYTGHSGALRDSGVVGEIDADGTNTTVELGFNTDYAAAVHERLNAVHPHGQAKFLETAMRANVQTLRSYVMDEMKKAL